MKNHLSKASVFLLFTVMSWGCSKESVQNAPEKLSELKAFYDLHKPDGQNVFKNTRPIWDKTIQLRDDSVIIYEVPMQNPDKVGILSKELTAEDFANYEKSHVVRMLLFVDLISSKITKGYYMAIEASSGIDLEKVNYKNNDRLNGFVMYYQLDGSPSNGVVYVGGKPSHVIRSLSRSEGYALKKQDKSGRSVQGDCANFLIETGYVYCVYTPFSDHCGWQSTGYASYTLCGSGSQGGDGGGGHGPGAGVGGGGDGGNSTISEAEMEDATVVDDEKPKIQDIKKYIDCFNDGKPAQSYTMTIYVDQPVPGQNDSYKVVFPTGGVNSNIYGVPTGVVFQTISGRNFDVGHAFVTFEKNNVDGTSVRQTLGFYPSGNKLKSQGEFKDNSGHNADVKYTMNVTKEQFEAALKKVENDKDQIYRLTNLSLNEYNCTTAAISWMNAAGANFTNSSSGLFKNTPGSFGQVLRNKAGAYVNPSSGIIGKGPCN